MGKQLVFGSAGFNGGGKDTLADVLVESLAERRVVAVHMSLSDALRHVVRAREKMAVDEAVPRELLGATSDALVREKGHPGALVLAVCEQFADCQGLVLSSVRRTGEAAAIADGMNGVTLFADATDAVRLSRLMGRARGDEVIASIDDLRRTEHLERYGDPSRPNDPGVICVQGVRDYILERHGSDCILSNEGSIEELAAKVGTVLARLTRQS